MITAIDCNLLRKLVSVPAPIDLMWIRPCDGMPLRKSLCQLAIEIEKLNPAAIVSVESRKDGHIWNGMARHMNADLDDRYLRMHSAMEVITDFSGIVIIVR